MKTDFKKILSDVGKGFKKHSPEIMLGAGIVGMLTTVVLAVVATPKAMNDISEAEEEKGKKLTKLETVKAAGKNYILPAAVGAVSTGLLICSGRESHKRNAALAAAYTGLEAYSQEYIRAVAEKLGEDGEKEIRQEVRKKELDEHPVAASKTYNPALGSHGEVLCYETLSHQYFWATKEKIMEGINKANYRLNNEVRITLNDLYDELNFEGLENTAVGDVLGFDNERGLIEPIFSSEIARGMFEGIPCLVLDYAKMPEYI